MKKLFDGYNIVEDIGKFEPEVTTIFDWSRLRDLPYLDLWQNNMDSMAIHLFRDLSKGLEENKLRIAAYPKDGSITLYLVHDYTGINKEPKNWVYAITGAIYETEAETLEMQYVCLEEILRVIHTKYSGCENGKLSSYCNNHSCSNCNINSSCPKRKLELIENDNDEDYPVLSVVFPDGWRVKPSALYDSFKSEYAEDFE